MMDRDKSYTLDRNELEEGMAKQGLALSVQEIDLLINFYDNDGAQRQRVSVLQCFSGQFPLVGLRLSQTAVTRL